MKENYDLIKIEKAELSNILRHHKEDGCRFVQMHAVSVDNVIEMTYSVATPENHLINYRIVLEDGEGIGSVSNIYPSASFYENEIKEQFGVNIELIELDYNNNFLGIRAKTPLKKKEGEK